MDIKRKKELIEDFKNRHPEIGVISYRCRETGKVFLGISKDTKSDFNSTNMKLAANWHPNKRLQELLLHINNYSGDINFNDIKTKELIISRFF